MFTKVPRAPQPLPDEIQVRTRIAELSRELRLLKAVEKALAKHRREIDSAARSKAFLKPEHAGA